MKHQDIRNNLLKAVGPHVPFDGWSRPAFDAAVGDLGIDPAVARVICPAGAVDLAVDMHKMGDADMQTAFAAMDPAPAKVREKIACALWGRLSVIPDRELVRKATQLFALPQHAPTGMRLIWGTCDAMWDMIGDTSDDVN